MVILMKAIIFDLDGTLWDTSDAVVDIWNEVLSVKCPQYVMTKEIMSSLMGKNQAQFVDEFFAGLEKEQADILIKEIFAHEQVYLRKNGAKMYSGVMDTLCSLKDEYKLAIVSNCQSGYLDAFLDYYGLKDVLVDYESAGNTGMSKGENIRLVMDRNNIKSAIYVGDTLSDQKAAEDAQIPFVYASYGFAQCTYYAEKIDNFCEITDVAHRLLK